MFRISRRWLMAIRTAKGGWTKAQFEALGLTYGMDNRSGWIDRLEGKVITESQKAAVEAAAGIYAPSSGKPSNKRPHRPRKGKAIIASALDDVWAAHADPLKYTDQDKVDSLSDFYTDICKALHKVGVL